MRTFILDYTSRPSQVIPEFPRDHWTCVCHNKTLIIGKCHLTQLMNFVVSPTQLPRAARFHFRSRLIRGRSVSSSESRRRFVPPLPPDLAPMPASRSSIWLLMGRMKHPSVGISAASALRVAALLANFVNLLAAKRSCTTNICQHLTHNAGASIPTSTVKYGPAHGSLTRAVLTHWSKTSHRTMKELKHPS
jgi:hypothetical protein